MSLYEVIRPYPGGPDGMRRTGEIVDASTMRPSNLQGLIARRKLRPYTPVATPDDQPVTPTPTRRRSRRVMANPEA